MMKMYLKKRNFKTHVLLTSASTIVSRGELRRKFTLFKHC